MRRAVLMACNGPCVTVLMPCRNPGPFLESALRSVLAQPDCLELLVADGACAFKAQPMPALATPSTVPFVALARPWRRTPPG